MAHYLTSLIWKVVEKYNLFEASPERSRTASLGSVGGKTDIDLPTNESKESQQSILIFEYSYTLSGWDIAIGSVTEDSDTSSFLRLSSSSMEWVFHW